jgi:hypothetical protein
MGRSVHPPLNFRSDTLLMLRRLHRIVTLVSSGKMRAVSVWRVQQGEVRVHRHTSLYVHFRSRECSFSEFSLKLQFNYDLIKRSSIHHYSPSPL